MSNYNIDACVEHFRKLLSGQLERCERLEKGVGRTDFSGRISADINPNPHIYDKCGDSLIFEAFAIDFDTIIAIMLENYVFLW